MPKKVTRYQITTIFSLLCLCFCSHAYASKIMYCLESTEITKATKKHALSLDLKTAVDHMGWTWVNPEWDGDTYPRDYFLSPDKQTKKLVPELYSASCGVWKRFHSICNPADSLFSPETKIAFIVGNKKSVFGTLNKKSFALYGDQQIPLPDNASKKATIYRGDAISVGFAALNGPEDELILFNATSQIELDIPESTQHNFSEGKWILANDFRTNRSFIHSNFFNTAHPFLYEVIKGPKLQKIKLDPNIKGWFSILSQPETEQIFMFDRFGIYIKQDNEVKRIAHVLKPNHLHGPANLGYTENNELYFQVVDENKSVEAYKLRIKSDSTTCIFDIDLEKDIDLRKNLP